MSIIQSNKNTISKILDSLPATHIRQLTYLHAAKEIYKKANTISYNDEYFGYTSAAETILEILNKNPILEKSMTEVMLNPKLIKLLSIENFDLITKIVYKTALNTAKIQLEKLINYQNVNQI